MIFPVPCHRQSGSGRGEYGEAPSRPATDEEAASSARGAASAGRHLCGGGEQRKSVTGIGLRDGINLICLGGAKDISVISRA